MCDFLFKPFCFQRAMTCATYHAETAAGIISLAQPLVGLVQMCTANIAHLTSINPHIQGVIRSASKAVGGAGAPIKMPRQRGAQVSVAAASSADQQPACGTSGFAFQGTNGHVVVQRVIGGGGDGGAAAAHAGVGGTRSSLAVLDRQRYWVIPETHALLVGVRATFSNRCVVMAVIDARAHAGLWDHRVMDRALFPGAGFLELSLCGASMMGGVSNAVPHWEIAVVDGAVPLPLVLSEEEETVTIEWRTDSGGESLNISSAGAAERVTPHLRAKLRRVVQQSSPSTTATTSTPKTSKRDLLAAASDAVFDAMTSAAATGRGARVATGIITEQPDNFAPYHTHPASLDNALQLAAACYVPPPAARAAVAGTGAGAGGDQVEGASLMVPAGFAGYAAPAKSSSGAATLRATADVHGGGGGERGGGGGESQSSSHALLGSSGVLLAHVKELEARRMRSQSLGGILAGQQRRVSSSSSSDFSSFATSSSSSAASFALRRRVMYRVEWDAAPHRPPEVVASNTADGRRVAFQSSSSSSSSVRATFGAVQALQVRAAGGGAAAASSALHTLGSHPHRSSGAAPSDGASHSKQAGSVWGVWTVAAAEAPSSVRWSGTDTSVNAAAAGGGGEDHGGGVLGAVNQSGAWATPRLAAIDVDTTTTHTSITKNVSPPSSSSSSAPAVASGRVRRALITGGLGSVALIAATWLAEGGGGIVDDHGGDEHGANEDSLLEDAEEEDGRGGAGAGVGMHPVLVSRTGRSSHASFAALALGGAAGAAGVTAASADVATSEDAAFACRVAGRGAAVVLHAAGTLRDAMLARQTAGNVRAVAAPKSSAAARWWGGRSSSSSAAAADDFSCSPLAAAVSFGSIAALVGSVGQAPYAASNAALG
jgi:hypothetical protein